MAQWGGGGPPRTRPGSPPTIPRPAVGGSRRPRPTDRDGRWGPSNIIVVVYSQNIPLKGKILKNKKNKIQWQFVQLKYRALQRAVRLFRLTIKNLQLKIKIEFYLKAETLIL